jgi:hypothetical protein
MTTNYPSSLDAASTVGGGTKPESTTPLDESGEGHPVHSAMHQNVGDALVAIETKLGTGSSTPAANKVLLSTGSGSEWGTVTGSMMTDNTVGQTQIGTNAVGADELKDDAVNANHLQGTTLKSTVTASSLQSVGTLSSLTVSGDIDANGVVKITDGSEANPSLTFDADEDTGIYRSADDTMFLVAGGNGSAQVTNAGFGLDLGVDFTAWPGTATGSQAEWVATGFGSYSLRRNSSLRAEKENIQDVGSELTADMIDQVEPKLWNRIHAPGCPEIGPIAEDMDAVSPYLAAHGWDEDGELFLHGINHTSYMSLLTIAVKDLRTQVADLTARLEALEG